SAQAAPRSAAEHLGPLRFPEDEPAHTNSPMDSFGARELLACYARGVFPMADARDDARVFLIDPERRGVIPLERFHVPRRLARTVRAEPFEIRIDTAFHEVVL